MPNRNNIMMLAISLLCIVHFPFLTSGFRIVGRHHYQTRSHTSNVASSSALAATPTTTAVSSSPSSSYDVIVVGSGIGGLSCAAMLSLYGYKVAVFESHYSPGGCAHGYTVYDKTVQGSFHFDTGPSFFSGLNPYYPAKLSNPLRTILDAIDEPLDNGNCIPYETFGLQFPEGDFIHSATNFSKDVLDQASSCSTKGQQNEEEQKQQRRKQWETLMAKMEPLATAVSELPTIALRGDIGVAITAAKFIPKFLWNTKPFFPTVFKLTKPFSSIVEKDAQVTDPFILNWLDLLCFCLSGLPANGTITAEMAMMMGEFYEPNAMMDCPKGGAKTIVDALVRGIQKNGGSIFLNSHVDHINIQNGRVTGITLRKKGKVIQATEAVVSNLSVWDLFKSGIVDNTQFPENFVKERVATPIGKSFMHMHIGFQISKQELKQLQAHYICIDDWSRGVDAQDNVALVSIPSVHDDALAPEGYAVLHIYTPATEDFSKWEKFASSKESKKKMSQSLFMEYESLKEQRSAFLWSVLEKKILPDIRSRAQVVNIGTPITHQKFLRRYKGSYGPAIQAGKQSFPMSGTPIKGLLLCGDSTFPGIGVPAVAGSGLLAANSISLKSLMRQLQVLRSFQ